MACNTLSPRPMTVKYTAITAPRPIAMYVARLRFANSRRGIIVLSTSSDSALTARFERLPHCFFIDAHACARYGPALELMAGHDSISCVHMLLSFG